MALQLPKGVPELGFYYHYKHDPEGSINNYAYEVIGVSFHTENTENFVIYRPIYNAGVYRASLELKIPCFDSRPTEMWLEDVEKNGITQPRFKKIDDQEVIGKLMHIRNKMYP